MRARMKTTLMELEEGATTVQMWKSEVVMREVSDLGLESNMLHSCRGSGTKV
jgi:hypothetical protein